MELSPLNGVALPTCAEKLPVCDVVLIEVAPDRVQPVKSPVSKPPLTIAEGGGALITRDTLVMWLELPLVPVMAMVYVPVVALAVVDTVGVELPAPLTG